MAKVIYPERFDGYASSSKNRTRVIAVTSGKGGVGKTNIVVNLGYSFAKLGKKVLVLDADLGLGNVDVLLGLAPKYNLSHVIAGEKTIDEILTEGPGGMKLLPAPSGIYELTNLSKEAKNELLVKIDKLIDSFDVLLIDTATGISSNVMDFVSVSQEIIIVASSDPASVLDAYAIMKVLSLKYSRKSCQLIVNMVSRPEEGREVFKQLQMSVDRFLDITIEYLGYVLFDKKVAKGAKNQKIVSEAYQDSSAVGCFTDISRKISSKSFNFPKDGSNFFWNHLK